MIALIVAVGKGNVIGHQGQMPWGRLPNDLNRFKAITMDHPVVVGAKTFESIGRVLPRRRMLVLTHNPKKYESISGCTLIHDFDLIFELAKNTCVYIAGGEGVYRQFVDKADIAYITRIHEEFEGDTFFPKFSTPEWSNVDSSNEIDAGYRVSFELWARGGKRDHAALSEEFARNFGDIQKK